MITETGIRCFLELSRTLNFTAAAENLYMTQQTVSKQIRSLEKDLDVVLFTRAHRAVSLTEEGLRLSMLFEKFHGELEDCLAEIKKARRFRMNRLFVGHQNWTDYGTAPLRAHIRMNELTPDFSLAGEVHTAETLMKLLSCGKLDLVMLYKRLAGELAGYRYLELKEVPVLLMASKVQAASIRDAGFDAFAAEPLIIDAGEQESERYRPDSEKIRKYRIRPPEILVRANRDSVYLSVELGHGITLGTSMSQIENRLIEQYPTGCTDKLICVWREEARSRLAEMYAQCLYEAFQDE